LDVAVTETMSGTIAASPTGSVNVAVFPAAAAGTITRARKSRSEAP